MIGLEMPSVSGEFGRKPVVQPPSGTRFLQYVSTVLPGRGEVVTRGDRVEVRSLGVVAANGREFESTWGSNGTVAVTIGAESHLWSPYLDGARIGERVVIMLPGENAYGEKGDPSRGVPPNANVIFVVDILARSG